VGDGDAPARRLRDVDAAVVANAEKADEAQARAGAQHLGVHLGVVEDDRLRRTQALDQRRAVGRRAVVEVHLTELAQRLELRGVPHVFRDVCVHRGTALSLGCVEGDELVCAYHGWRYRGDGACAAIPQLADPTRVPARARAFVYTAQERYGIVWAALEPPARPLPEVPELDDPAWRAVRTGPFAWTCDASRQVENFTDFGHFAFVHEGLLGDRSNAVVAP